MLANADDGLREQVLEILAAKMLISFRIFICADVEARAGVQRRDDQ